MALSINTPPADNALMRDPQQVDIATDNMIAVAGATHQSYIHFTAAPTIAGSHLTIEIAGETIDMVSQAGVITADGLHYRVKLVLESLDDWLPKFAEDLAGNYFLGTNYIITADTVTDRINIVGKEDGEHLSITFTTTPGTSTATVVTAGTTEVLQENYRLFAVLDFLGGYFPDPAATQVELDAEYIGSSVFRARYEKVMRSFLKMEPPAMDATGIQAAVYHALFYRIKYYEAFGALLTEQKLYTGDDFYCVMHGAQSESSYPTAKFFDGYDDNFKWLTWQKRTKRITRNQKEWLAFAHVKNSAYDDYRVKVKMYYTDGTNETAYTYDTDMGTLFSTYSYLVVLYLDCSYDLLIDPIAAMTVTKYEVTIVDAADDAAISETFTFIIEEEVPVHTRYFIFENSLGWWDTLRTTGDRIEGANVTGEVLKKFLPADYAVEDGKYMASDADAMVKYTQSTGWMKGPDAARYFLLFMISSKVFEIIDGEFVPCIVTRREIRMTGDDDKQWGLEFEYTHAYDFVGRGSVVV